MGTCNVPNQYREGRIFLRNLMREQIKKNREKIAKNGEKTLKILYVA